MKLFLKKNLQEGEAYPKDIILSCGSHELSTSEKGWYVKLTLPFKKKCNFLSVKKFEPVNTVARYSILYRRRPANEHRKSFGFVVKGWHPIEDI